MSDGKHEVYLVKEAFEIEWEDAALVDMYHPAVPSKWTAQPGMELKIYKNIFGKVTAIEVQGKKLGGENLSNRFMSHVKRDLTHNAELINK